ncbi:MAG: hypothetical protein RL180_451 [Pseudomonadota bacterium]
MKSSVLSLLIASTMLLTACNNNDDAPSSQTTSTPAPVDPAPVDPQPPVIVAEAALVSTLTLTPEISPSNVISLPNRATLADNMAPAYSIHTLIDPLAARLETQLHFRFGSEENSPELIYTLDAAQHIASITLKYINASANVSTEATADLFVCGVDCLPALMADSRYDATTGTLQAQFNQVRFTNAAGERITINGTLSGRPIGTPQSATAFTPNAVQANLSLDQSSAMPLMAARSQDGSQIALLLPRVRVMLNKTETGYTSTLTDLRDPTPHTVSYSLENPSTLTSTVALQHELAFLNSRYRSSTDTALFLLDGNLLFNVPERAPSVTFMATDTTLNEWLKPIDSQYPRIELLDQDRINLTLGELSLSIKGQTVTGIRYRKHIDAQPPMTNAQDLDFGCGTDAPIACDGVTLNPFTSQPIMLQTTLTAMTAPTAGAPQSIQVVGDVSFKVMP